MFRCLLSILTVLALNSWATAQPATAPAEPAAERAPLQATITGVEGVVQVRAAEDQPWQPARNGMVVGEGAEFRTGPRSAVRFTIGPDQTITLDRLGTVKVLEAVQRAGKLKTDLGMKYGRVRFDIEAAGVEHDATIHSPGSTLAVRGTQFSLTNELPFRPVAVSLTGRVRFKDQSGRTTDFGRTGQGRTEMVSGFRSAADTAIVRTYVDPAVAGARSAGEQQAILTHPDVAGFVPGTPTSIQSFTQRSAPVISPTPPTPNLQSGSLVFALIWTASLPQGLTPDLDLYVFSPLGEVLKPKTSLRTVPSGGQISADDRGGTSASTGQEVAFWANGYPPGTYRYEVRHQSGGSGEFQVAVVRNGQTSQVRAGTLDSGDSRAGFSIDVNAAAAARASRRSRR